MRPPELLSIFGSWNAGAGEITIFFLVIIIAIGLIIFSYFFYKKKQEEEHRILMKKKYDSYIVKLSLTGEEQQFIEKLADFLKDDQFKYHILTNRRVFSQCASELKKRDAYPVHIQDSIKKKLNFPGKQVPANYFSSEDLPRGMPALLMSGENSKNSSVIWENSKDSVILKLNKPLSPLREGTAVAVYFHDNQKIFTINTTVLEHDNDLVKIAHSLLQSQKRRAFKRKKIKLPVLIKHSDFEEIPMHSYIIDLSEGGASLENPDFNFKKHERITFYYHIETEDGFSIRGEILRLSAKGRIIHVKFFDRDLTIRSRIKTIVK